MIVSIHQPSYWPWLGHLNKIINSEHHIILDDVDIKRKSFQYRNFFNNNGKPVYWGDDTHWNALGIKISMMKVGEEIKLVIDKNE